MKTNRLFMALSAATLAAFVLQGAPAMAQSEAEDCATAMKSGTEDGMAAFKKAYPNAICDATSSTKGAAAGAASGGDGGTGSDAGGAGGGDSGSNTGGSGGDAGGTGGGDSGSGS